MASLYGFVVALDNEFSDRYEALMIASLDAGGLPV
jgi:hypothetical protein